MAATRLPKSPNLICFAHVSVHYSILAHADLVSFTEGIRNGKLHFLCSPTKIKVYEQIRGGLSYYRSLNHVVHEQWAVWWPLYLLAFWNIELLFLPHIYIYIYTNLPVDVLVRLPHPRSGHIQDLQLWHRVLKPCIYIYIYIYMLSISVMMGMHVLTTCSVWLGTW